SYCVLIGPEGDFSGEELKAAIELEFRKVSLGPSRLRTETAGIAACHILNLVNE
ncbi:MAG: RsmE family RNA methyltransferase, partial [Bacteroidota bacterium]|nr:RsmE family RNA methyltransferase [Bacteroidota bacterium]